MNKNTTQKRRLALEPAHSLTKRSQRKTIRLIQMPNASKKRITPRRLSNKSKLKRSKLSRTSMSKSARKSPKSTRIVNLAHLFSSVTSMPVNPQSQVKSCSRWVVLMTALSKSIRKTPRTKVVTLGG